jgi:NADPH:quinone reductase-like Zn-dependent oxidoreductase
VCSASKAELVKRIGADRIVNYHTENILDSDKRYDVIFNCVRGSNFWKWRKLLKTGGKQILIAANPAEIPFIKLSNWFSSRKSIFFLVDTNGKTLEGLSVLIIAQKVKPIISKTFSLNDLAQAHRLCETGSVAGKISIAIEIDHTL